MNNPVEKNEPVAWQAQGSDGIWRYVEMPRTAASMGMAIRELYAASTVEALQAENAALLSQVERLRAALKPIANAAEVYEGHEQNDPVWAAILKGQWKRITVQNLRDASAALQEKIHD